MNQQTDKQLHMELKNVSFSYQNHSVLKDVSLSLYKGEKLGIIGANGVGKTTLMKLPLFLLSDFSGGILIDGTAVTKKQADVARKKIGYIFQDSDNQLFCNSIYDELSFGPRKMGLSKSESDARVMRVADNLSITHLLDRQPFTLSGGEKKLVAIASVLTMEPEILFLDEPSIALDPKNRRNLIHILKELPESMVLASHDLDMILDVCDRVVLLCDGGALADGSAKDILTDEALLTKANLELPLRYYVK